MIMYMHVLVFKQIIYSYLKYLNPLHYITYCTYLFMESKRIHLLSNKNKLFYLKSYRKFNFKIKVVFM